MRLWHWLLILDTLLLVLLSSGFVYGIAVVAVAAMHDESLLVGLPWFFGTAIVAYLSRGLTDRWYRLACREIDKDSEESDS